MSILHGNPYQDVPTQNLRVLIVEDDVTLATLLQEVAAQKGYRWTWTENGREGLQEITKGWHQNDPYHIMFLDINMPEINGTELCQICRNTQVGENQTLGENIWVIAMSADTTPKTTEAILGAGADDFIPKPLSIDLISSKLSVARINIQRRQNPKR